MSIITDYSRTNDRPLYLARCFRLAVIQSAYAKGRITEDEARELLKRPLVPGDYSSVYDDSGELAAVVAWNGEIDYDR